MSWLFPVSDPPLSLSLFTLFLAVVVVCNLMSFSLRPNKPTMHPFVNVLETKLTQHAIFSCYCCITYHCSCCCCCPFYLMPEKRVLCELKLVVRCAFWFVTELQLKSICVKCIWLKQKLRQIYYHIHTYLIIKNNIFGWS